MHTLAGEDSLPSLEDTLDGPAPSSPVEVSGLELTMAGAAPAAEISGLELTMAGAIETPPASAAFEHTLAPEAQMSATLGGPSGFESTLATGPGARLETTIGGSHGGHGPGATIDRYLILSKLGAGGMGVVYAAYDPELDRKVALKLVLPALGNPGKQEVARARLLREAQALAKLNHPNVVSVHDVGVVEAGVWIAMEFVAGQTLGDWAKAEPRSWAEILEVMREAGEGLAAAHAAGLLHRDFKPDNVMVGEDGRTRVMDFGLARTHDEGEEGETRPALGSGSALALEVTAAGSLLGTPAYMSPEQWRGEVVTAHSDQFSFCVTLWELLYDARPYGGDSLMELMDNVTSDRRQAPANKAAPAWLRRVCERGLSHDPELRHANMLALMHALAQARSRRRTRWLVGAAASLTLLCAGGAGAQQFDYNQRVAACEAAGASMDEVWNEGARERLRDGFARSGLLYASNAAALVQPWLGDYAEGWTRSQVEACTASSVDERWTPELHDKAQWCLDERRQHLRLMLEAFERGEPSVVEKAVNMVAELPPAEHCVDEQLLAQAPAPPPEHSRAAIAELREQLLRGEVSRAAGDHEQGLALVQPLIDEIETLEWPVLYAEARTIEGQLLRGKGDYSLAGEAMSEAYYTAARAGAWGIAASAAASEVTITGYHLGHPDLAASWAKDAELALHFAGDPLQLGEAQLANNRALVQAANSRYEQAEELFRRGLELREAALGPQHPTVAGALNNIAAMRLRAPDYEQATALFERSLAVRMATNGLEHPATALVLANLGRARTKQGEFGKAREHLEQALELSRALLPPGHADITRALGNLADVYVGLEDWDAAERTAAELLALLDDPDSWKRARMLVTLAEVSRAQGRLEQARERLIQAVDIWERTAEADGQDSHQIGALERLIELELERGEVEPEQVQQRCGQALVAAGREWGTEHDKTLALRERIATVCAFEAN